MTQASWVLEGDGPVVAAVLHDGHDVREEVAAHFFGSETDRWREEDRSLQPGQWGHTQL